MIVAGAENRPPMLDKSMYNSWQSHMLLYIKGKKNGRMMLESIENVPLVYPTIEENAPHHPQKYQHAFHTQINPTPPSVPQNAYHTPPISQQPQSEFPQLDSGLAVPSFLPGDNPIACLNKAMAFMSTIMASLQGRQGQSFARTGNKGNATSSRGNNVAGQARVVKRHNCQGEGNMERQCNQPKRPRNSAWFKEKMLLTDDLNTYDSDCDDISSTKAVLMANLSSYDLDVLSDDISQIQEKESECNDQRKENNVNNTNNVNAVGTNEYNVVGGKTSIELSFDPNMPALEDYSIFDFSRDDEDDGTEADMNNLDTTILENQKGFKDPNFPDRVYKVEKALYGLHQAPRAWYETLSTYLLDNGFQRGKIDKTLFIKRLISWQCKKQTVVANSTIEAKYVAASSCCGQTKRIEIRHHFIRDYYEKKLIQMVKIHTDKNVADLLTKAFDLYLILLGKAKKSVRLMMEKLFGIELELILFWSTVKAKTINGEVQLHALVDGKKIIIIESIVRRDLQLEDAEDEAVYKELDESLVRTATTASSLEAEHDSGNTLRSGEDSMKLNEWMELYTNLQTRVLDLEKTKITQAKEVVSLKRRVKKLELKKRSRTHRLKRLYKVGLTTRVESSRNRESLGKDASKQGRINAIDADEDITLVNDQDDVDMFNVNTLTGDEVLAEQEFATKDVYLTVDEVTLAQALAALKSVKPKVKANIVEEPSVAASAASTKVSTATTTTTVTIPTPRKGIVLQELDESTTTTISSQPSQQKAIRLQAEFDEEERLAREKDEANVALTKEWNDIQAKVDVDYQLAQRLQAEEQE
ncbi:ribonuclease H-like domain-containing protein [Tanacetum coccineum]